MRFLAEIRGGIGIYSPPPTHSHFPYELFISFFARFGAIFIRIRTGKQRASEEGNPFSPTKKSLAQALIEFLCLLYCSIEREKRSFPNSIYGKRLVVLQLNGYSRDVCVSSSGEKGAFCTIPPHCAVIPTPTYLHFQDISPPSFESPLKSAVGLFWGQSRHSQFVPRLHTHSRNIMKERRGEKLKISNSFVIFLSFHKREMQRG